MRKQAMRELLIGCIPPELVAANHQKTVPKLTSIVIVSVFAITIGAATAAVVTWSYLRSFEHRITVAMEQNNQAQPTSAAHKPVILELPPPFPGDKAF